MQPDKGAVQYCGKVLIGGDTVTVRIELDSERSKIASCSQHTSEMHCSQSGR